MRFNYGLTPALIGVSIVLVQTQVAVALSSQEVGKIAKEITVLIKDSNNNLGSGVIIKRDGNTYTVLTAAHVVGKQDKYEITTYDNQRYAVNYSTVKKLSDVDLAVVQFSSNKTYNIAKIGNSDGSTEGTAAYVAGFPKASAAISSSVYTFTDGKITANALKPLRDGYTLVYNNDTLPGMSGGPVLNDKGELIGIHGRGDTTENLKVSQINPDIVIKTGFNLGIPINTFSRLSTGVGVNIAVRPPDTPRSTTPKPDDFFIQGEDKSKNKDFQGAVVAYNEAIRLNPKYAQAYLKRGIARAWLGDQQGAITDINQALRINPNYDQAYVIRGVGRYGSGDFQGAIADFNQAQQINPKNVDLYVFRGATRTESKDFQGAIADYNQAIKINPNYPLAYSARCLARAALKDYQGAIADCNQALRIDPNFAYAYINRGITRAVQGDRQGGISDVQKAADLALQQADTDNYQRALGVLENLKE